MSAEIVAGCAAATLVLLVLTQRRLLLSLSAIGIFFASHVVLVAAGLVAAPWLVDTYLPLSFPYLRVDFISERDVAKAIVLVIGGMALVVLGYRLAMAASLGSIRSVPPASLLDHRYPLIGTGIRPAALLLSAFAALLIVTGTLLAELPTIQAAIASGFEGETYYQARFVLDQHGRLFAYAALNVLPFLAACVAGATWLKGRHTLIAYAAICTSVVVSILTFKKIPLLNQLLSLIGTWYVVYANRRQWRLTDSNDVLILTKTRKALPRRPLVLILGAFVLFAAGSYYLVSGGGLSFSLALGFAVERVFSRLTMTNLMYAHYFPDIEGHYGLRNVGFLADLLGTRLYEDTVATYQYFLRLDFAEGSGAIGALTDFYAAFGWSGWLVLSLLLGVVLYILDRFLGSLQPLLINRVFHIFVLITVTFLAQASVFRTLSTYGGGILVLLWLFVGTHGRLRPVSGQPGVAASSGASLGRSERTAQFLQ